MIPGTVRAQVSLRIVPDQDLDTIAAALCAHVRASFAALASPNSLKVRAAGGLCDLERGVLTSLCVRCVCALRLRACVR